MPLYEYQCPNDGRFEVIQKFSDEPLKVCPTCGAEVQKLLSAPAFQFKGTGWYITDYARKGGSGGSESKSSESKSSESKSDTKSESKSDSSSTSSSTSSGTSTK